jgi:hypothetical protein
MCKSLILYAKFYLEYYSTFHPFVNTIARFYIVLFGAHFGSIPGNNTTGNLTVYTCVPGKCLSGLIYFLE